MDNRKSNKLLLAILLGIILGMLVGGLSPVAGRAVKFIGELFIRALLMLVVPLIIATMTVGISRLGDIRRIGGIGGKTITYYLATTALSVIVGITLVNLIQPGQADTEEGRIAMRGGELLPEAAYSIDDLILTLDSGTFKRPFDDRYMVLLSGQDDIRGIVAAEHESAVPSLTVSEWTDTRGERIIPNPEGIGLRIDLGVAELVKGKSRSIGTVLRDVIVGLVPRNLFAAMLNNDVLPLIIFSLLFGAVLTTLGEHGRPVLAFFEGLNEAIMKIVHLLMLTAPVGIGALIAGRLGDAGGFSGFGPELIRLGQYAGTVLSGLLIHALITLPLILHFSVDNASGLIP